MVVRAGAQEAGQAIAIRVAARQPADVREQVGIRQRRREVQRAAEPDFFRDIAKQVVHPAHADGPQHPLALRGGDGDVFHDRCSPISAI